MDPARGTCLISLNATTFRPPSDEEQTTLSDFLRSTPTAMDLERFDGFLCALVAGPDTVMPSEYWPIILGCDPGEVEVFSSLEQAQRIFTLVITHWNSIATRLDAGEIYYPIILENDEGQASGQAWARDS